MAWNAAKNCPQDGWPSTHWTQLGTGVGASEAARLEALDRFMRRYWSALLAHLAFKFRLAPELAEDVAQSFIADRVVKGNLLAAAAPGRGRFRNFLLRSLDNFSLNWLRRESAGQRQPPGGFVEWKDLDGWEPMDSGMHPGEVFDIAWAVQVMEQAREQMHLECRSSGRNDIWDVFAGRILGPLDGTELVSYETLASRLGYSELKDVRNLLTTGNRMFQRCVRAVVGQYVGDDAQIGEEIIDLLAILSRNASRMP